MHLWSEGRHGPDDPASLAKAYEDLENAAPPTRVYAAPPTKAYEDLENAAPPTRVYAAPPTKAYEDLENAAG